MNEFTHLNESGEAHMVDVSAKEISARSATAQVMVRLNSVIVQRIVDGRVAKGDLLAVARVAGIQAAKKCADLIPLCHPLPLSKVAIDLDVFEDGIKVVSHCRTSGQTGVEMEALTAASVAALTIYDMCKSMDKGIVIEELKLLEKSGGKSGDWSCVND